MKKITILFGEMGSGKSHLGRALAGWRGVPFIEGDNYLPNDMLERVQSFLPLTLDQLDRFLLNVLPEALIREANASKRGIVVAQAMYRDCHRRQLRIYLETHGFEVELVYVNTPFFRNMKQIWTRKKGTLWVGYWLLNKLGFQVPTHSHVPVSTEEHIELFASWSR